MSRRKSKVQTQASQLRVDDYKDALFELLDLEEMSQQVSVGRLKAEKMSYAHALVAHSLENVRAAVSLIEAGKPVVAMSLTRVAFELAVYAQLVHQHPDGVSGIKAKITSEYNRQLRKAKKVYGSESPLLVGIGELEAHKVSGFAQAADAFGKFEAAAELEFLYSVLSPALHPSNLILNSYLHYEDDSQPVPSAFIRQATSQNEIPLWHSLVFATLLALGVYEDIRKAKPHLPQVKRVASRVALPSFLPLRPSGN